jgi:hypothetical protein
MQENMKEYWSKRRANIKLAQESGKIVFMRDHRRLQVIVPQHKDFIRGAQELAGRFKHRTQIWSFDYRLEKKVRELVEQVWPGNGSNRCVARFQMTTEE